MKYEKRCDHGDPTKDIVVSSDCSASVGMSNDDAVKANPYLVGKVHS